MLVYLTYFRKMCLQHFKMPFFAKEEIKIGKLIIIYLYSTIYSNEYTVAIN
jgi:hypothetical protein